jgi:hypothetical protein
LLTVTAQDACGWFTHCGYLSSSSQLSSIKEELIAQ